MNLHLENLPRTISVHWAVDNLADAANGDAARAGCRGVSCGDAVVDAGVPAVPQMVMIDQRALPSELVEIRTSDWWQVVDAVKTLAVRGAPAIGVAGAAAVMLAAYELAERGAPAASPAWFAVRLREAARVIAEARPTAVNLSWGVNRAIQVAAGALKAGKTPRQTAEALRELTGDLIVEDEATNRAIGAHGAALLAPIAAAKERPLTILTHCNAGSLATAFYGTALGVVYAAAAEGLVERVWADETRPVGQGARLTVWELARAGVPATLLCDNMAASLMAAGRIDAVVVGADRIAANGDVANKIGTLGVAVLAHHFAVPFFVAAPVSTVDVATADGAAIPIEERDGSEVCPHPPEGVALYNPAFDVTPASLIAAIVTEEGAFAPSALASALVM